MDPAAFRERRLLRLAAREYNLPLDAEKAADVIAQGFYTTTDLGMITAEDGTKRWFGTIACAGFDSLVTDRTNRMTWPKGKNRYNLAIGAGLMNWKTIPTRLVLDHDRVVEVDAKLCSIGNTRTYGGGMHICPNANHHDGLFDITVMEDISRVKAAGKFANILRDKLTEGDGISFYRAAHVRIEMETEMNCDADGDVMAPLPIDLEIVPGAGRYLVPRPSNGAALSAAAGLRRPVRRRCRRCGRCPRARSVLPGPPALRRPPDRQYWRSSSLWILRW